MANELKLTYASGYSNIIANVFSPNGATARGSDIAMSDTGHSGLYLGTLTTIRLGDIILYYQGALYLTGQVYQEIDWTTVSITAPEVLNITLCNQALGLLGAKEISADEPTERNYLLCEQFYANSRDEILVSHPWNWASKVAYAIQTTNPLFGYDNAFTVPSDCLRVLTVEQGPLAKWKRRVNEIHTNEGSAAPDYDDDSVDYLAEQYISASDVTYLVDTAFTSSDETTDLASYCTSQGGDLKILELDYIKKVTDVSTYPAYMTQCLFMNLAIKLSSPIIQGATTQISLNLQTMLFGGPKTYGYLAMARSTDAQEAGGEVITTDTFLNARR